jgi:hypothetical protein
VEDNTKKTLLYAIPVVVVLGLAAALWYGRKSKEVEPVAQEVTTPPVATPSDQPEIRNPIDGAGATDKPLPAIDESDADVHESLTSLFGTSLDQYLVPQSLARNIVATIDNLPRRKIAATKWPLKPTAGAFVASTDEAPTLSAENYARYAPLMTILRNADAHTVAQTYRRYYPMLQQAYVDLGYPNGYFNDRLVEVIDHLLEAPDLQGPVKLTQPGVFYEFADPALESRSAGQKLLMRMGPENETAVKEKLKALRAEIARNKQP